MVSLVRRALVKEQSVNDPELANLAQKFKRSCMHTMLCAGVAFIIFLFVPV